MIGESLGALAEDWAPTKFDKGFDPFAHLPEPGGEAGDELPEVGDELEVGDEHPRTAAKAFPRKMRFFDDLFAMIFDLAFFVVLVAWLVVIAPIQYVGNLVAGAPARLALANPNRVFVLNDRRVVGIATAPRDEGPKGWEEIGLARHPVALTAAITAALLLLVSYFA